MIIALVLIDNGSVLNVCTIMTLGRIGIEDTLIHHNGMMVRTFDGTKTTALEEIDLTVSIEPCEFEILFVAVDILAVLTCS